MVYAWRALSISCFGRNRESKMPDQFMEDYMRDTVAELVAENKRLRRVLEKIACRHVTEAPLWWQTEARDALSFTNGIREGKT